MYKNYGDVDFFQWGVLVDDEHEENVYEMLLCRPYDDKEDLYQFGHVTVDITDKWIDKERVMLYIGMTNKTFDPIRYAIGCTDFYSWENFDIIDYSFEHDWTRCTRKEIENQLRKYIIATDNLEITW